MDKKYNLKLDLQFRCNNSTIKFNQFDNNTSDFFIHITNGGKLVDIEKALVVLATAKPSGKVSSQFVEVKNGVIYADLKSNMRDEIGVYTAQAMLVLEDERVITDTVNYEVNESKIISAFIEDAETQEDYVLLTDMLSKLSTIEISEEQRMTNEAERILSEENRKTEEARRVEAELIRVHEEANRAKYDVIRESNENTRKANEVTRKNNETQRIEAETQRQNRYNSFILDAEANASNFENYTNTAKVKEEERKSNELDRQTQEAKRVSNEVERISNEKQRQEEHSRKMNEVSEVVSDIQKDYDSLQKIIIDENASANLQNQINQTNSQLAHNTNYLDNKKLDKNGIVTMANMGQDVREAMTGGSVAVVGKNTILTENIVNNQVTPQKTTFLKTSTENLLHLEDITITKDDITVTISNGHIITINGKTATNKAVYIKLTNGYKVENSNTSTGYLSWANEKVDMLEIGRTYCLCDHVLEGTINETSEYKTAVSLRNSSRSSILSRSRSPKTLTEEGCYIQLYLSGGATYDNYKLGVVLEERDSITPYSDVYTFNLTSNIGIAETSEFKNINNYVNDLSSNIDIHTEQIKQHEQLIEELKVNNIVIYKQVDNMLGSNLLDYEYVCEDYSITISDGIITINGSVPTFTYLKLTNGYDIATASSGYREVWGQEKIEGLSVGNKYHLCRYVLDGKLVGSDYSPTDVVVSARTLNYTSLLSGSKGLTKLNQIPSYVQLYIPPGTYVNLKVGVVLQEGFISEEYTPNGYSRYVVKPVDSSKVVDYPTRLDGELFFNSDFSYFTAIQGACTDGKYIYCGYVQNGNDNEPAIVYKIDIKTKEKIASVADYSLGHCNSMTYCDYDGYIHCVSLDTVSTIHRITTDLEYVDSYEINILDQYPESTGFGGIDYNAEKEIFTFLIRGSKKGYALFTKNLTFIRIIWVDAIECNTYGGVCTDNNFIYQAVWLKDNTSAIAITTWQGEIIEIINISNFGYEIEEPIILNNKFYVSCCESGYRNHSIYELTPSEYFLIQ